MVSVHYTDSGDLIWHTNPDGSHLVYNIGNISFLLSSMACIFLMALGVGFFYSGMLRRKNALSALYATLAAVAVVILQWFLWGFSLAFSDTSNIFIGNLRYIALSKILAQPTSEASQIPLSLYCLYELMFAVVTAAIAVGAIAERGRLGPLLIFVFIWSTIVYDPVAYWTWNTRGWGHKLEVLDFAGGIAVHICSGFSALAISVYLGPRYRYVPGAGWAVNNVFSIVLGTVLMWYGWFGFNGGSALSANLTAIQACINTNIAAAAGGLAGVVMEYRVQKKWGAVSFCSGAIAGLVTITPGSGFVSPPVALLFGFLGGIVCNLATGLKRFGYDDSLDIFAVHGIGGLVGSILTGIFAQQSVYSLSGMPENKKGWLDKNWKQVGIQLAVSLAAGFWSFIWTWAILKLMSRWSLTKLRASRHAQGIGMDEDETGEEIFDQHDFPGPDKVHRWILEAVSNHIQAQHPQPPPPPPQQQQQ